MRLNHQLRTLRFFNNHAVGRRQKVEKILDIPNFSQIISNYLKKLPNMQGHISNIRGRNQPDLFSKLILACHSDPLGSRRGIESERSLQPDICPGGHDGLLDCEEHRRRHEERWFSDSLINLNVT